MGLWTVCNKAKFVPCTSCLARGRAGKGQAAPHAITHWCTVRRGSRSDEVGVESPDRLYSSLGLPPGSLAPA